ncbi:MAG: 50S ribosomal protein L28 [Brevinematales bacterium]|nr:50S ribosomal protein L28 [Brevinematales bacterium]
MSRKCDICGKGPVYGNNISHSHRKTRTRWLPNLKKVDAIVNGEKKKVKVCMGCLHANKVEIAY